jgi:hypothetical protein
MNYCVVTALQVKCSAVIPIQNWKEIFLGVSVFVCYSGLLRSFLWSSLLLLILTVVVSHDNFRTKEQMHHDIVTEHVEV